jgi:hypothetical protein
VKGSAKENIGQYEPQMRERRGKRVLSAVMGTLSGLHCPENL